MESKYQRLSVITILININIFVIAGISEILCTGGEWHQKRHLEHIECDNFLKLIKIQCKFVCL